MMMPGPAATPLFDTPVLLGRLALVREALLLSPGEVRSLFGSSERELHASLRAGETVLPGHVEAAIRIMDEVASLAAALLGADDVADWVRAPCAAMFGRTPLDVLANEPDGLRAIRDRLRDEHRGTFG